MKRNQKLSSAIIAILNVQAAAANAADAVPASGGIAEIVVTAQRRSENIQNVPISIQAMTGEMMRDLNITTFDDLIKFTPNVTTAGYGPGMSAIYMRGLATTQTIGEGSGSVGSMPNVGTYLDDQSIMLPGRNLDILGVDLERIEVLEGPQGTLYGAGAQAGAVRYITNKPRLNTFEAVANASYATTAHGDPSNTVDLTLNLPLIEDKLAVRVAIYNESRGGYISNVPGQLQRQASDPGISYYFGGHLPPSVVANNTSAVGDAINSVVYKGIRASVLYKINDDWNALITQSYQDMKTQGVFFQQTNGFDQQTPAPDLSVRQYVPGHDRDSFSNTAWTLTGRIGELKAVYTGGFLTRNIDQTSDYTSYSRGSVGTYYTCRLPTSWFQYVNSYNPKAPAVGPEGANFAGQCYSPVASWHEVEKNTHQSHEFRLSTPDDWRLRAIGGLFWEDFKISDYTAWNYVSPDAGFVPIQPLQNVPGTPDSSVQAPGIGFLDDISRGYTQKAAFGSVDFDIVPKSLTLTVGTRWFSIDAQEQGQKVGSYGCRPGYVYTSPTLTIPAGSGCQAGATNLDTIVNSDGTVGLHKKWTGFKSRANLTWKITPDAMVYATWSEGFRPGGFNRGQGVINKTSPLYHLWTVPYAFDPDNLTNKEIGWKTQWLHHRLQFNGAVYQEDWKNAQLLIFNPSVFGNLTFGTNGPNYRVKGLETEIIFRATDSLTLTGSAAWNSGELINNPTLVINYPGAANQGSPIPAQGQPFGQPGSPLAQSPPIMYNLRARYDFSTNDYKNYVQISASHQGHSYSTTDRATNDFGGGSIAFDNPAYTTYDASLGTAKDAWTIQLYVVNLTDKRADVFTSAQQIIRTETVNRPRTIGLRIGYQF